MQNPKSTSALRIKELELQIVELEKENLRLQRKIAALQAANTSLKNRQVARTEAAVLAGDLRPNTVKPEVSLAELREMRKRLVEPAA